MVEFKRAPVQTPVEAVVKGITIDPLCEELAEKAKTLLGYGLLQEHLQQTVVTQNTNTAQTAELAKVLTELECQPFNTAEVKDYMKAERKRQNRKSRKELPHYVRLFDFLQNKAFKWVDDIPNTLFVLLLIASVVSMIMECCALWNQAWKTAAYASPMSVVGACLIYVMALQDKIRVYAQEWSWQNLDFCSCYQRKIAVPYIPLDTATRIKQKLPNARLSVEILISSTRLIGDPFLRLDYGGQTYYLEAWEESEFEKTHR